MNKYAEFKAKGRVQKVEAREDENLFAVEVVKNNEFGEETVVRQEYHLLALADQRAELAARRDNLNAQIADLDALIRDGQSVEPSK